jgi:hypothetical protein
MFFRTKKKDEELTKGVTRLDCDMGETAIGRLGPPLPLMRP